MLQVVHAIKPANEEQDVVKIIAKQYGKSLFGIIFFYLLKSEFRCHRTVDLQVNAKI